MDAQAYLNLRWAHISEGKFAHVLSHMLSGSGAITEDYIDSNFTKLSA